MGADVNGDGIDELIFTDYQFEHTTDIHGEVYVFTGGSLSGTQTLTNPSSLLHTLRGPSGQSFGLDGIKRISQPRAGDTADWLAIADGIPNRTLIFKGTSNPGADAAITAGIVPADYSVGSLDSISYNALDFNDWSGNNASSFGSAITTVTLDKPYVVVSTGFNGSGAIYFYTYEQSSDGLVKSALIPGHSTGHAQRLNGAVDAGSGVLLVHDKNGYNTIKVQ
jgi:hypothetical protein